MGCVNSKKVEEDIKPLSCSYCDTIEEDYDEFYFDESGLYSLFAEKEYVKYACKLCAYKPCDDCGKVLPRSMFIDCKLCKKTHCFNNTNMNYDSNPVLSRYELCNSRHCYKKLSF